MVMVILSIHEAASQEIRGPFHGSIPASERRLNRGVSLMSARTSAVPMGAEPRKKARRDPDVPPNDQPPAAAPAGTNYVLDSSTVSPVSEVPPLILASFQGVPRTEWSPPDPVIAAGPRHLVAAANKEIRIMTREGSVLETIDARAWCNDLEPGCVPFDPRVYYDHFTGRYMMLWHEQHRSLKRSHLFLFISVSDDPTGQWVSWAFPGNVDGSIPPETWADNGCIGFDSNAVYIVSNQYTFDKWEPVDVAVMIIPKRELYSDKESEIKWTGFSIAGAFCVRPAVVYDHSDAYYLLEARNPLPTATAVKLYRLENGAAGYSWTSTFVPVTAYGRAMNAGQAGGGEPFDVRSSYLHSEVQLRSGSLHAVFSIANPISAGYSALRYLCINTATITTSQDITFGAPGHWYYFPAVAVNRNGDVAITFSRSGLDEYPGCFFTWRTATDADLRPAMSIQPGWANYQLLVDGKNRWGDYSGAAVDPTDWTSFWLMGEYADGPNIWGSWVKAVRFDPFQVPRLIVDRRSVDFGNAGVGELPVSAHMTIRNGGVPDLTISNLTCSAPFAIIDPPALPARLALYDSLLVDIAFSPSEAGLVPGELSITSDDVDHPSVTVPLQGTGIEYAGTAGGVIYAVEEGTAEDILHFLGTQGDIRVSKALGLSGLHALTVDMSDGRLYGAAGDNHGAMIVKIDGADGTPYPSYAIALHGIEAICAIDPDTFYCGTSAGSVYRFIPSTSELTIVVSRQGVGFSGLVQSSTPDLLWASAGLPVTNDTLYAISVRSGSIIPIGTTGTFVATESICRASDGGLLGLVGSALVRIDTLTGNSSVSARVALDGLRAIAEGLPVTGVAGGNSRRGPEQYALEQNFPNPFNPSTTIRYEVPMLSYVTLAVFNTLGQKVATLVQGEVEAGHHNVTFDASGFTSGVYFCRMSARGYTSTRKLLMVR